MASLHVPASMALSRSGKALVGLLVTVLSILASCKSQPTPRTLRVWQTETDKTAVKCLNEMILAFEQRHPGVDVQMESVAWSSLSGKLAAAVQAHNEPDVAHLEPFMVASLANRNLLVPLDDVIKAVEEQNQDSIYEGVRDLQRFDGSTYGIAYAVGTTGWAYRRDWAERLGATTPSTWADFIPFARRLHEGAPPGASTILLPGGDPFFIDQLFAELVANNGGSLFEPRTRRPLLTSPAVKDVLQFFAQLGPYVDRAWQTQRYLDQFHRFGRGEAAIVPVTYARAAKAIQQTTSEVIGSPGASAPKASPDVFALMPQPRGPAYTGLPIATIDCEPFVVFRAAEARGNVDVAKDFLKTFYSRDYYLPFVRSVPIHLTPIFKGMAASREYTSDPFVVQWKQWAEQTRIFLDDRARVRPILMPDVTEEGRRLPFLLELQASQILTRAVTDVVAGGRTVDEAAQEAQSRAERLVVSTGEKAW